MPTELIFNSQADPSTTLSGNGGSITAGATTLNVASAAGTSGTGQFRIRIGTECIIVGAGAGTTTWSSLTRGAEGTTAASHNDGDNVYLVITAGTFGNLPYAASPHGSAGHSGSVFPVAGQTLQGDMGDSVANTHTLGAPNRFLLATAKTIRTEDLAGAAPSGGAAGDIKVGTNKLWARSGTTWFAAAASTLVTSSDYLITYDGTTTNAINLRTGAVDFSGGGSDIRATYNSAVAALDGLTSGHGGVIAFANIQTTNAVLPAKGTLNSCDGLTLRGSGYGKRGQSGFPDTSSVVIQATATFTNNADIPAIDGNVLLDFGGTRPRSTVSTITWLASVATVTTTAAHGLATGDLVYITGVLPTGYNTVGDNSAVTVTVTSGTVFTYALAANPGAYTSGGTVYPLGTRQNVTIEDLALSGNNLVDVTLLIMSTGTANASRVMGCQVRGGKYNVVQLGSRAVTGGSGDVYMSHCQVSHNDTPGTENALVSVYAGDAILLYNNFAVPNGNAFGLYISTSATPVFVGWCHIGGGGTSVARVKITGGQNIRLDSNYIDNAKDTVNGGIWIRPIGASMAQCQIRNNHFNMAAAAPWIVVDGTTSTTAQGITISGNQSNGNSAAHCPSIVKFVSWVSTKEVHVFDNIGQFTDAVTTGAPSGQIGRNSGNRLTGIGTNGDMQEEHLSFTGTGTNTAWTITHHLFGAPTQVTLGATNLTGANSSAFVSAKAAGTITVTTTSVATPSWDVILRHNGGYA